MPASQTQRPPRRQLAPVDPPMVPFALTGIAAWIVVGLVLLGFRPALAEQGREHWITICVAGALLGLPGLALMIVHDRNRRARRAPATSRPNRQDN